MSNERDAASGDGLEPVDPSEAADAAASSPAAGAASESSAGDDKPGTAPAGDGPGQPDAAEPDSGDGDDSADSADSAEKAQILATQPAAGPVAAGSARAAARRSAAQALSADGPNATERRKTEGRKTEGKGMATPSRGSNVATRPNIFQRLGLFLREVVAELRKVIWPSRNQMVTYTIVVIIFVSFMVALVAGFDLLFAKGVLAVFG